MIVSLYIYLQYAHETVLFVLGVAITQYRAYRVVALF